MDRGNCNVNIGEGLFYINWDDLNVYTKKDDKTQSKRKSDLNPDEQNDYEYDIKRSQENFDAFKQKFIKNMTKQFKSLIPADYWRGRDRHVILENKLFMVAFEDNKWSLAVELLLKDDVSKGLQKQLTPNFINGLQKNLLKQFTTIHTRTGSWSSAPITAGTPIKQTKTTIKKEES